jgi:hypothetical protein
MDRTFSRMLGTRNFLASEPPEKWIPDFASTPVVITQCPSGDWATPFWDTLILLKGAAGFRPHSALEIGSYRGITARLLAENTPEDSRIYALDTDPDHGQAYRGLAVARKIHRLVGKASEELAREGAPYDLVFINRDHGREGVFLDSVWAWNLLSERGVIFWHDYQTQYYFVHAAGAVPEALREFQIKTGAGIVALQGTWLALFSRFPRWETPAPPR